MRLTLCATATAAVLAAIPAAAQGEGPSPLPRIAPEAAGFSPAGLARIDAFFAREIAANRVPGAVVGIVRDGGLVYLKAFGDQDRAAKKPMQVDSIFGLASMTKVLTAVGALSLTEQGRLPLYSRLADYYPAFASMQVAVTGPDGQTRMEKQARPIRIQDLMRHTSGLTYGGRPDSDNPAARTWPKGDRLLAMGSGAAYVEDVTKLPLVYQPGTVFEYGESFDVLAAVVEKVTGKSHAEHLAETVFGPLGMADTGFALDGARRERVSRPFAQNPLDGKPQRIASIEEPIRFACGGACALGTVPDYLRFGQMLLNGGALDGHRILSPSTVALLTHNQLNAGIKNRVAAIEPHREGYGFGLGVAVRTEPGLAAVPGNVGEYSWNGAYGTGFFADPAAKLVVVFGTAAPGELRKYYREQVQDLVYGAMVR